MISKLKLKLILLIYFLIIVFLSFADSQELSFVQNDILYQDKFELGYRKVTAAGFSISFYINDKLISQIPVDNHKFMFLTGTDNNSFGLIKHFFRSKNEKSYFEVYLLDSLFKISFFKKVEYNYEENLPKFLQISSNEILLLYPSTGKLIYIFNGKSTEINLLSKSESDNAFQERIGHLISYKGKIFIFLSQIEKNKRYISKLFEFDKNNFLLEDLEIDLGIIHKIFVESSRIFISGYYYEPQFAKRFFELILDENLSKSRMILIEEELIEEKVKESENLFFSRDCFFKLEKEKLLKLNLCLGDEVILNSLMIENNIYVITRKNLDTKLYVFDENFKLINQKLIRKYLVNPELKKLSNKELVLIDGNKKLLLKNISEEE